MGIALVAHVKDDFILRQAQRPVQRDRQLHHAQVGGKMSACGGNAFDQEAADLVAQDGQFLRKQLLTSPGRRMRLSNGYLIAVHLLFFSPARAMAPAIQQFPRQPGIGMTNPINTPRAAPASTWMGVWPTISFRRLSASQGMLWALSSIHSLSI